MGECHARKVNLYFAVPCTLGGVPYITPDVLLSTLSPERILLNIGMLEVRNVLEELFHNCQPSGDSLSKFIGLPEYTMLFTPRSQLNSSQDLTSPSPYQFKNYKPRKVTQTFAQGKTSMSIPEDFNDCISKWCVNMLYASVEFDKKEKRNQHDKCDVSETFNVICPQEEKTLTPACKLLKGHDDIRCSLYKNMKGETTLRTHCSTPWDILEYLTSVYSNAALETQNDHINVIMSGNQPITFAETGVAWLNLLERAHEKTIDLRNPCIAASKDPIDKGCACISCTNYSRGYIHHLLRVHEMNGTILIAIHNLYSLVHFVENVEKAINEDGFKNLQQMFFVSSLKQ